MGTVCLNTALFDAPAATLACLKPHLENYFDPDELAQLCAERAVEWDSNHRPPRELFTQLATQFPDLTIALSYSNEETCWSGTLLWRDGDLVHDQQCDYTERPCELCGEMAVCLCTEGYRCDIACYDCLFHPEHGELWATVSVVVCGYDPDRLQEVATAVTTPGHVAALVGVDSTVDYVWWAVTTRRWGFQGHHRDDAFLPAGLSDPLPVTARFSPGGSLVVTHRGLLGHTVAAWQELSLRFPDLTFYATESTPWKGDNVLVLSRGECLR